MEVITRVVGWQGAYESHYPCVKVVKAEDKYWVIRANEDPMNYFNCYITKQPTLECVEAWFEGVVKGTCKPSIMM